MSAASRIGLGRALVGLYPEAWRDRYRDEVLALLEDDPPGPRGLCSLLAGACDAHLRPRRAWGVAASPLARVRLSVGAVFACWIAVSLAGAGFQKTTEEPAFDIAARQHPLLAISYKAIEAGAVLGALAVAVGGLPLLWHALVRARAGRDGRLLRLIALPPLAILAFFALSRLLFALAPARDGRFPVTFVLGFGAPWLVEGLACALVCALVPRAVLRHVQPPARDLRRAYAASVALTLAMGAIVLALLVYEVSFCVQAHALASQSSGPVGASCAFMLAAACALAALATAGALTSTVRARRAFAVAG